MPFISNHILQKKAEKQKETLKRLCDLPHDLQCVVLNKMQKNEQRRLSWTSPLIITQHFMGSRNPISGSDPIIDLLMESNAFDFDLPEQDESEASSSHEETRPSGGAASNHGEAASNHGEAASSHGEAASSHSGTRSKEGKAVGRSGP